MGYLEGCYGIYMKSACDWSVFILALDPLYRKINFAQLYYFSLTFKISIE